jgi:hypothetical protein
MVELLKFELELEDEEFLDACENLSLDDDLPTSESELPIFKASKKKKTKKVKNILSFTLDSGMDEHQLDNDPDLISFQHSPDNNSFEALDTNIKKKKKKKIKSHSQ